MSTAASTNAPTNPFNDPAYAKRASDLRVLGFLTHYIASGAPPEKCREKVAAYKEQLVKREEGMRKWREDVILAPAAA